MVTPFTKFVAATKTLEATIQTFVSKNFKIGVIKHHLIQKGQKDNKTHQLCQHTLWFFSRCFVRASAFLIRCRFLGIYGASPWAFTICKTLWPMVLFSLLIIQELSRYNNQERMSQWINLLLFYDTSNLTRSSIFKCRDCPM